MTSGCFTNVKKNQVSAHPRILVSKYLLAITAVSLGIEQCSKAGLSLVGIVVSANDGDVISKSYQNYLCPFYRYFAVSYIIL